MDLIETLRKHAAIADKTGRPHCNLLHEAADEIERLHKLEADAERYRWLRARDLDTIHIGGVFVGMMPQKIVMNGDDLDFEVDAAMALESAPNVWAEGLGEVALFLCYSSTKKGLRNQVPL